MLAINLLKFLSVNLLGAYNFTANMVNLTNLKINFPVDVEYLLIVAQS